MNFNITRRQFLQYCAASAAALGLSQTDLLKLEKALAAPQTGCSSPTPSVIWLEGQNCSGCQTSLLNRMVDTGGTGYYDADLTNALYTNALGLPPNPQAPVLQGIANDPVGLTLNVVNDVVDLLVGDAVGALVPPVRAARGLAWADDNDPVVPGTNTFPGGYITLEFLHTINAGAGTGMTGNPGTDYNLMLDHIAPIVNGGLFVLLVDGTIPTGTSGGGSIDNEKYCYVFDDPSNHSGYGPGSVTMADAMRWMAPQAAAIISVGTCASYGGIPAARRNKTGAKSVADFCRAEGIGTDFRTNRPAGTGTPIINVAGCPPHPDWIVHPIAHLLVYLGGVVSLPGLVCDVDNYGRPLATYGHDNVFCDYDCPNVLTQGVPPKPGDPDTQAAFLGDNGCLGGFGCKGNSSFGDCPGRKKNVFDDGTVNNWCIGAEPNNYSQYPNRKPADNIAHGRHPCQGCIQPNFPDGMSPFYGPRIGNGS